MRPIKFRAWDKQLKAFVDVDKGWFTFWNDGVRYNDPSGYDSEDLIMCQFTGLHDNTKWEYLKESERADWTRSGNMPSEWKGRQIYEGDIVSYSVFDAGEILAEVEYCGALAACYLVNHSDGSNDDLLHHYGTDGESVLTVIGNIYENPDLIK